MAEDWAQPYPIIRQVHGRDLCAGLKLSANALQILNLDGPALEFDRNRPVPLAAPGLDKQQEIAAPPPGGRKLVTSIDSDEAARFLLPKPEMTRTVNQT